MRILRPVLLALLSAVVGLGVPAGFGQAQPASKTTPKKKTGAQSSSVQSGGSPASRHGATSSSTKNSPATKPSGTKTSGKKATGKTSSGKTSSRKSRRQQGQKAPAAERVSEIQTALAKDGSFSGTPNGKWDDDTTAAVRRFQASRGLNATGKLDAPTLQRLGLGSQIAGVAAPTPPPGAVSRLTSSSTALSDNTDPSHRQ
jgi:peptidoglycan hydrolase-like protein with peptidoglycan-binding domain